MRARKTSWKSSLVELLCSGSAQHISFSLSRACCLHRSINHNIPSGPVPWGYIEDLTVSSMAARIYKPRVQAVMKSRYLINYWSAVALKRMQPNPEIAGAQVRGSYFCSMISREDQNDAEINMLGFPPFKE